MNIANSILSKYADRLTTRCVVCESGLTTRMPAVLAEFLPTGRWLMVADDNTWFAQGQALAHALTVAGAPFDVLNLTGVPGRLHQTGDLVCNIELVNQVLAAVHRNEPAALIAVGSGTICDTVKLAAAAANLPSAAVATAPSMNGYPSIIAAVLRDGVKRTDPASPPVLVLADLDVLCAAPPRMIDAGLADLLAKPVSTADWTLANALLGDPISADGLAVVEESAKLADGIATDLPSRQPIAVARLFESLFVSGLAMAASGASSPASGGEHLISHYLDMTASANQAVQNEGGSPGHDLHGLQVGVATLVTARLYQRLLAWDPASLDVAARVRSQRPFATIAAELGSHFGPTLAAAVIPQAQKLYAGSDALADRLTKLKAIFPALRSRLQRRLMPPESIERELLACGAATRFDEIGVSAVRARSAVRFAHHVRSRYTILHLLADLGHLDAWAETVGC